MASDIEYLLIVPAMIGGRRANSKCGIDRFRSRLTGRFLAPEVVNKHFEAVPRITKDVVGIIHMAERRLPLR
jgi:hypothetical protein